ncbi:MAG: serine/threonine protein kinase, partial [Cyanobacteria bacterium]|nr:serine/threonine protein kinase [Cyanobacteriota bacterium]
LYYLKQISTTSSSTTSSYDFVYKIINGNVYRVVKRVELDLRTIEVQRPAGKKSHGDYKLKLIGAAGEKKFEFRWGDVINPQQRNSLLTSLEQRFPADTDLSILEPFRVIPQRQSYTEIWLRELSGAPKRDKLTPLQDACQLAGGKYTVMRKVGVGGQATVYLASSTEHPSEELVVLKEFVLPIFPDLRVRQKAAERFQAEATMLSRLQHPRIARFLDLFVEDHRAYLVLEHIEGKSLKETVASLGPLPEKEVVAIAIQLCEIVGYLHSQSPPVVHRDLTPDNIMYGSDGLAKLIDFSVAQELSSGVTGSVVGKPNYISPEQFRGKPTTQSDIYSLGATLGYLLLGHDPPPITMLHPKAENEKISDRLDAIVARCTQLDTGRRYDTIESVLADLKRVS